MTSDALHDTSLRQALQRSVEATRALGLVASDGAQDAMLVAIADLGARAPRTPLFVSTRSGGLMAVWHVEQIAEEERGGWVRLVVEADGGFAWHIDTPPAPPVEFSGAIRAPVIWHEHPWGEIALQSARTVVQTSASVYWAWWQDDETLVMLGPSNGPDASPLTPVDAGHSLGAWSYEEVCAAAEAGDFLPVYDAAHPGTTDRL